MMKIAEITFDLVAHLALIWWVAAISFAVVEIRGNLRDIKKDLKRE